MGTDIHGIWQSKTSNGWEDISSLYEQNRHYFLFAWLANVRNGYGFAGVPTHEEIKPLSDNRGLPEDFVMFGEEHPIGDVSFLAPWRQKYQGPDDALECWMGDHSFSWVSGKEVLEAELPVRVDWSKDASSELEYFINEVKRLVDDHGEIRFVFGFDS